MKKYRIITAIATISLVLIAASSVYFINFKRMQERNTAEMELKFWKISSMQNETMYRNTMLREVYQNQLLSHNIELPQAVCDSVPSHFFVLRLTETLCMSCHEKNIQLINEHFSDENTPDLLVLGSYTSNHSFMNELSYIKGAKKSVNIPDLNISPIDSVITPYIFSIDSSGKIQELCFLLKGEEEILNFFLEKIAVKK